MLIEIMSHTPTVLESLIDQIPSDRRDTRQIEGQWSVKEWLCHLIDAQDILMHRFKQFETEDDPLIADYEPPPQTDTRYLGRDFNESLVEFAQVGENTVKQLQSYDAAYWKRTGRHESFSPYGTKILLGHTLNVDYAHLFSMERIGLGMA